MDSSRTVEGGTRSRFWPRLGLAVIVALGLGLRIWRLGASGFITPYYMAACAA